MTKAGVVLVVGGIDPGAGAGLAADLRALAAIGQIGAPVVAAITVQSTNGLRSVEVISPKLIRAQMREVLTNERVLAIKTGALGNEDNVHAVATVIAQFPKIPVVVDPVISPSRGRGSLLRVGAISAMLEELLPLATVVAANAQEATALSHLRVRSNDDAEAVAVKLLETGAMSILVKGGHLTEKNSDDTLALRGGGVIRLARKRLVLPPIHGGGCTLASLIAGALAESGGAQIHAVVGAIETARAIHLRTLRKSIDVGGAMRVLDPARVILRPVAERAR